MEEFWRTGCILKKEEANALVEAIKNQIRIRIKGKSTRDNRDLMIILRGMMDPINEALPNAPIRLIPLPALDKQFVNYDLLINLEKEGEKQYTHYYNNTFKRFQISELLDGIPSDSEVSQLNRIEEKLDGLKGDLGKFKKEIVQEFKKVPQINQDTIITELQTFIFEASDIHYRALTKEMEEKLEILKSPKDNFELKLKASIPLLEELTGVGIEASFNFKSWAENMYEKHKIDVFRLLGKL